MTDTERTCPLLVITRTWKDDDTSEIVIAACDQPLYVVSEVVSDLGDPTCVHSDWRVRCGSGHVLVVPDDDTGENPIHFHRRLVEAALDHTTAEAP